MENYLLLLLFAAMLFGGCSKNDDEEDNGKVNSSTKRVVDSPYIEYDEKGRWTKALGYKSIVYGTDEIKVVTTGEGEVHFSYEFLLNAKGLVKSYKVYEHYKGNAKLSIEASLEYDDTDHLIAVEDRTYTWSDGNIVKIHLSKSSDDIVYKYSSEEYIGDIV